MNTAEKDLSYLQPSEEAILRGNKLDLIEKTKAEEREEKKRKNSPYARFYQVNEKQNKHLRNLAMKEPKALAILLFIFEKMDGYNAVVLPTSVLMETFNLSRTTICKCIKYLKDHGFIYIRKAGNINVYIVNDDLVWKSWGKNTAYCEFPANIVLTSSEQDDQDKIEKNATQTNIRKYKLELPLEDEMEEEGE